MGGSHCVAVLPGNGDGTFDDVIILLLTEESAPQDIVAGDFNGDGQIDLAVAVAAGAYNVSVLLHTGEATSFDYESPVNYNLGPESYSIASGDFDGDEDLDLAITTYGAKSVALLENDGFGTFAAGPSYSLTSDTWEVQSADLDDDENLDIGAVSASANSQSHSIPDDFGLLPGPDTESTWMASCGRMLKPAI